LLISLSLDWMPRDSVTQRERRLKVRARVELQMEVCASTGRRGNARLSVCQREKALAFTQ
jgi:hypothetical protein